MVKNWLQVAEAGSGIPWITLEEGKLVYISGPSTLEGGPGAVLILIHFTCKGL